MIEQFALNKSDLFLILSRTQTILHGVLVHFRERRDVFLLSWKQKIHSSQNESVNIGGFISRHSPKPPHKSSGYISKFYNYNCLYFLYNVWGTSTLPENPLLWECWVLHQPQSLKGHFNYYLSTHNFHFKLCLLCYYTNQPFHTSRIDNKINDDYKMVILKNCFP